MRSRRNTYEQLEKNKIKTCIIKLRLPVRFDRKYDTCNTILKPHPVYITVNREKHGPTQHFSEAALETLTLFTVPV